MGNITTITDKKMKEKIETAIKPTVRELEEGGMCTFPLRRKNSVYVAITDLKIENPGRDYTTNIDREEGVIRVRRTR